MKLLIISASLLLAGLVNITFAKEPLPLPTNQVSVELAAPPMEGTVSIGVFDATGKCIRVLFKGADSDKIPSALNGFLVNWDGKTDAGNIAPKGEYEIRGVTVGDVSIEGEAYHFNDWIDTEKSGASPANTKLVKILSDGDFLTLQAIDSSTTELRRFHHTGGLVWKTSVANDTLGPVVLNGDIFLTSQNRLQMLSLGNSNRKEISKVPDNMKAIAVKSSDLLGIVEGILVVIGAPSDVVSDIELPPNTNLLAANSEFVIVSNGGEVFQQKEAHFSEIKLPVTQPITHLAMTSNSSFWVSTADATLTEFDLNGQPLRSLDAEGEDTFLTFDVNAADNQIALVSKKGDRQRFRILELTQSPSSDVSLWKTTLQKDIQPCDEFGIDIATSKLVPKGDLPPEKSLSISLIENPLTPDKKGSIAFTPASLADGLWLTTQGGLPVIQIASDLTSKRMALVRDKKPDSLRFYANIGGAVAEFSIGGLSNMMQFTSEKIQWPPGPRQAADEKDVPSNEPAPTPE